MDDPRQIQLFEEDAGEISLPEERLYLGEPPGGRLAEYVKHFATVEIDSTFYGTPRRSTVERWRRLAPEGFLFTAKLVSSELLRGKPSLILTPMTRMLLWAPSNSLLGQVNFGVREHF